MSSTVQARLADDRRHVLGRLRLSPEVSRMRATSPRVALTMCETVLPSTNARTPTTVAFFGFQAAA